MPQVKSISIFFPGKLLHVGGVSISPVSLYEHLKMLYSGYNAVINDSNLCLRFECKTFGTSAN